ncbi:hypothetical protein BC830DRAFT_1170871 [Chytriomyces sp. MP71]|nr:hypothetical protein BC830DRAFT_1170871 [Chytriomyces sp. MP71]
MTYVLSAIAAGRSNSLILTPKKSVLRKDAFDADAPPPQPSRSVARRMQLSPAGTRAKAPGPPSNGAGDDDAISRNIDDAAKDGVLTLLRTTSVKRTATLARTNAFRTRPSPRSRRTYCNKRYHLITCAAAKAAFKAEFNIAELQVELAALRGTDQAAEFLAPGE